MWANSLLASVAILLLASYATAVYNAAEYCQLVPVGTKLPSLTSCQTYYICQNNRQVIAANCDSTNIFDKDYQECVPASVGNCASGNPCAHKNKIWVSDANTCGVWHYCVNGVVIGSGMCPNNEVFNDASQLCQYGECSNTAMTDHGLPLVDNVCSIMQNEKFFGDFNNCHAWHRCNGMTLQSGICEDGTTYDSSQRSCVYSNGNTCAGPISVACNAANNGNLTADSNICSVYYQCVSQNNQWSWQRNDCPHGDYYDVNMKNCQSRQAATPIATCDRCEYATTTWVNAVDSNCTEYLTCSNSREIASGYCNQPNSYFNEEEQTCVEGGNSLSNYRTYNGACALSPSTSPSTSGNGTTTSGSGSTTGGSGSTTGSGSTASGSGSTASGTGSTTTGSGSTSSNSTVSGSGSTATGSGSTTTGSASTATGSGSSATGSGSTATESTSTGSGTTETGSSTTATGSGTTATESGATATGSGSTSTDTGIAGTGNSTTTTGSGSPATGSGTTATGSGNTTTTVTSA